MAETIITVARDYDIRRVLSLRLAIAFPAIDGNLILHEFSCRSARIDVAVVNHALHGYEIKSGVDTLARLDRQVASYEEVFDHTSLVVGERHLAKASAHIPEHWGVLCASVVSGKVTLEEVRPSFRNNQRSPKALAALLLRPEIVAILLRTGEKPVNLRGKTAAELRTQVAQQVGIAELSLAVRNALRARKSDVAVESQTLRDDSCTTISSTQECCRIANRQWLLQQSVGPHN